MYYIIETTTLVDSTPDTFCTVCTIKLTGFLSGLFRRLQISHFATITRIFLNHPSKRAAKFGFVDFLRFLRPDATFCTYLQYYTIHLSFPTECFFILVAVFCQILLNKYNKRGETGVVLVRRYKQTNKQFSGISQDQERT